MFEALAHYLRRDGHTHLDVFDHDTAHEISDELIQKLGLEFPDIRVFTDDFRSEPFNRYHIRIERNHA